MLPVGYNCSIRRTVILFPAGYNCNHVPCRSWVWAGGCSHHDCNKCPGSQKIFQISYTAGPALGREVILNTLHC